MKRNSSKADVPTLLRRMAGRIGIALVILCVGLKPVSAAGPALPDMIDTKTQQAIDAGLKYLADTQRRDGSWSSSGGYGEYPTSMTSLAGLAFLAGGSTPQSGPYWRNVARAMHYLLRAAEKHKDGMISASDSEYRSMYGHGFAMLFLAQCYGMEPDQELQKRLRKTLQSGVSLIVNSQSKLTSRFNKPCGGWYYTPSSQNDEGSVTVTQLQALRACRNVGIYVPPATIDKAVEYLRHCQLEDGGICYSAEYRHDSRPAISAAAIACFYAAGVYDTQAGGKGSEAEMVQRLIRYCDAKMSTESRSMGFWYYAHFYFAQAKYQQSVEEWRKYFPRITRTLLAYQSPDGSWTGDGIGTTYGTAIATIILQLPYGYLPIVQR